MADKHDTTIQHIRSARESLLEDMKQLKPDDSRHVELGKAYVRLSKSLTALRPKQVWGSR